MAYQFGEVTVRTERTTDEGRQWDVKKELPEWMWAFMYSVVGVAILLGFMFFLGTVGK